MEWSSEVQKEANWQRKATLDTARNIAEKVGYFSSTMSRVRLISM